MAPRASSVKRGKRSLSTSSDNENEDRLATGSPPSSPGASVPNSLPTEGKDVPPVFHFNYRFASNYITKVKETCSPLAIGAFRELINDLSVKCVEEADVVPRLENMFGTYQHLVRDFKVFRSRRGKFTDVASTVQGVHRLQSVVEEILGAESAQNPTMRSTGGPVTSPPQIPQDHPMDNMVEVGECEDYKAKCAANLAKDRARLRKAGLY